MHFGLKNARATYQRLVNKMFKEMIGKMMKVYIDNMLVKNLKAVDHITHLEKIFWCLAKASHDVEPLQVHFRSIIR